MAISFRISLKIILILIVGFNAPDYFAQSIKFNHLTVENGLSNNDVNTLLQDRTGFIWFGTEDGLNRYDGYSFKIFRHNPVDSNSLSSNVVWSLVEDRKGNIWVGTVDGILNQFDPENEKFIRWDFAGDSKKYTSVTSLFEDSNGNIWIGTRSRGVYKFNPVINETINYRWKRNIASSLSHTTVRTINEDSNGNIIIGTYNGLNKFNPNQTENGFQRFFTDKNDPNSLTNNQIYNLSKSRNRPNVFWIGTPSGLTEYNSETDSFKRIAISNPDNLQFGAGASTVIEETYENDMILWIDTYDGLVRMNLNSRESYRFTHDENNPNTIIDNQINKIIKDKAGVIWLATESGISYLTAKGTKFNSEFNKESMTFFYSLGNKKDLNDIYQNNDGDYWFGFSEGIIKLKYNNQNLRIKNSYEISGVNAWSLLEDDNNFLWVGTYGQGLIQYDLNTGGEKRWELKFKDINTRAVPFVKSLFKDSQNRLWIGYWGSGLGRIDLLSGNYDMWTIKTSDLQSISYTDIWSIKEDRFGRIWIGIVGGGLNLFENKDGGKFYHWMHNVNDKNSLNSNNVYSIYEAKNDSTAKISETILWIGTNDGLNKFLIKNNPETPDIYLFDVEIESFTVDDGLSDNTVNSILEDEQGNLWLGTGSGISFFDVVKKTFINFTTADGINGRVMNSESALKLDNGLMLFGSKSGLNIFDPKKIKLSEYKPSAVITDFQIFNRSVEIGENSPLKESILSAKEIILSHDQNVFSFEFAALDYNSPQFIKYAYKMEGFDNDWIESGNRRYVTYTNLNPGEYLLKVKSTNADGVWNTEETSLSIIISPPWWQTPWAYISYFILIAFGLLAIRRFEINRTKLRNELKLQQLETEQKTKLDKIKSRFFANLSHEFRTPLMLIKGPLEQLKESKENYFENINLIERNSDRLKNLIDQLLELSQLEKAVIPIRAKKENLTEIMKGLINAFETLAIQNNISFKFENKSGNTDCWVDRDKFEKIINNLLSNAFKFTPNGGSVNVLINNSYLDKKEYLEIAVSDTGVGIPSEKLNKIFDRFFQVDDSSQRSYGGSGIGLALVKELVELHKWKIFVQSDEGKGTNFKITIPMWDDYLNEDVKIYEDSAEKILDNNINKENTQVLEKLSYDDENKLSLNGDERPVILIVEDTKDVRKYLKSLLNKDYTIYEAVNGLEGIKSATDINPDLILSDIMMPSMDGLEFCSRIKSEWQTSDIPVILLTAKASFESKIEGLEIGADDYLTKPFESKELRARIKNLLEQRKRLRDKYSNELETLTGPEKLNTADDEFIKNTLDLIQKNLDKTNFSTEHLANELFVSRTQLHRKIMAITGQAPGELIRTIKLKRAAKMLLEKNLSVTQIAYEIGFANPSQFARAFKKQFNCLPSDFSAKQKIKKPK